MLCSASCCINLSSPTSGGEGKERGVYTHRNDIKLNYQQPWVGWPPSTTWFEINETRQGIRRKEKLKVGKRGKGERRHERGGREGGNEGNTTKGDAGSSRKYCTRGVQ